MKIKTSGKIADYRSSPIIGKQLTLIVNDDIAEQLDQMGKQSLNIEIQPLNDTKKRSKNANAYMWQLLNALQEEGFGNALLWLEHGKMAGRIRKKLFGEAR